MEEAMDTKPCPRKLDFNAPLISTRRPTKMTCKYSRHASWDMSNGVPFSWEQTPGKAKGGDTETCAVAQDSNLPPPPKPPPCKWHPPAELVDEGGFSDAIDFFSLSESVDIDFGTTRLNLSATENDGIHSPSFIIQRYLSDAKALAAGYKYRISPPIDPQSCSSSTPKSCGLDIFFPWRMKHKLCGVKSPVKSQWATRRNGH